jgi:hypothetical protein
MHHLFRDVSICAISSDEHRVHRLTGALLAQPDGVGLAGLPKGLAADVHVA